MSSGVRLSDYCLADHTSPDAPRARFKPVWYLAGPLFRLDPRTHFTGLRGAAWRLFGITRSSKNPNVCTI